MLKIKLSRQGGNHVKVNVVWKGQRKFAATGESGHSVLMDASIEAGGEGKGVKPTEMVLMGVAGCSGIDIVMILEKMREKVSRFAIEVDGERADTEPKRFTTIKVTYKLEGEMRPVSVEKAIRLSLDKYCSVSNSMNARFAFAYEVNGIRYPETGFMA